MEAKSVLEEFRRRRKLLENLRPTTATARLGEMWNFLNSTPETKEIIKSITSVGPLIKAGKAKDAKNYEEITGVGIHILEKCNEGEHITKIVSDLGIGVKQPKPSQQSYTNDAGEFVNKALDFIEDKLEELVTTESKQKSTESDSSKIAAGQTNEKQTKYGEGPYGQGPYSGDEKDIDDTNFPEYHRHFMFFLQANKGYPSGSLGGVGSRQISGEYVSDIVVKDPESEQKLAVIEVNAAKEGELFVRENSELTERARGLGVPLYVLGPDVLNSSDEYGIQLVTEKDDLEQIAIEDFPTFNMLRFICSFESKGKSIVMAMLSYAEDDLSLKVNATSKSWINLQTKGRTVAQLHRYGESGTKVGLALAGHVETYPDLPVGFLEKGRIEELSGYQSSSQKEINWLNGKMGHDKLKYPATVYVVVTDFQQFPEGVDEVKLVLQWAKEKVEHEGVNGVNGSKVWKSGSGNVPTMVDDKASVKDLLGRMGLVEALANMFVHSKEMEGFTVALFGNWGEGKSTIMKLLEKHLEKHHRKRFVFAKFNAWEYEKTDNLAAGLALEVVKGLKKSFNFLCRITLYICFILREHWNRFIWWVIKFGLAVLPFILLYFFRGQLGLTERQNKLINDLLGISLAGAGSIVIGFYVLKNFKHIVEHPLVTNLETFLKLPNYGKHLGLVPVLKRHIKILCSLTLKAGVWKWRWGKDRKLIVFVDDLDRCQPKCIAETLDAIRLVMENPNVIVFIGIDHRIAFKAIGEHYKNVGDSERRKGEIARDYLGKIIQLPIRLQEPTVQGLGEFINEKLFPNVDISEKTQETLKPRKLLPSERTIDTEKTQEETGMEPEAPPDEESAIDTTEILSEEITEEEMQDTKDERDEFCDMAKKFEFTNPRQLLRLRNCYRLIKALELQKARKEKRELGFKKLKSFMRMLFWQEFLHNRSKDLRKGCVKVLCEDIDAEKISDEQAKVIVKQVKGLILESFADKKIYDETAEVVRIVVLPHSQED